MTTKCKDCDHWVNEAVLVFREVENKFTADPRKMIMEYDMQAEAICKPCFRKWLSQ